jgi:hypothetical protein
MVTRLDKTPEGGAWRKGTGRAAGRPERCLRLVASGGPDPRQELVDLGPRVVRRLGQVLSRGRHLARGGAGSP